MFPLTLEQELYLMIIHGLNEEKLPLEVIIFKITVQYRLYMHDVHV